MVYAQLWAFAGERCKRRSRTNSASHDSYNLLLEITSPAARIVGASAMPSCLYAGLPRSVWRAGIRMGLMRKVRSSERGGVPGNISTESFLLA